MYGEGIDMVFTNMIKFHMNMVSITMKKELTEGERMMKNVDVRRMENMSTVRVDNMVK